MFYNVMQVGEVYGLKRKIMRYRPKRENYPSGKYGEMDYQERLERYCTYLENKLSKLHQPTVSGAVCEKCKTQVERDKDGEWCGICQTYTYDQQTER